jgi:hypothetical protein
LFGLWLIAVILALIFEAVIFQGHLCFQVGDWRVNGAWLHQGLFRLKILDVRLAKTWLLLFQRWVGLGILDVRLVWSLLFPGGLVDVIIEVIVDGVIDRVIDWIVDWIVDYLYLLEGLLLSYRRLLGNSWV